MSTYLAMALDPLHPGAGGYRLGRVDLTISRDPATRLPKVPGTGLHGAIRAHADMALGSMGNQPVCGLRESAHHPDPCPICYTFGSTVEEGGRGTSYRGVVEITDAQIVLFPVSSMLGPVWLSTAELFNNCFGTNVNGPSDPEKIKSALSDQGSRLNLGWLLLEVEAGRLAITGGNERWNQVPAAIRGQEQQPTRVVLVSALLFSQLVNTNLEVRTSVVIDPATGAAKPRLLFTHEAIPRLTFLSFEVIPRDYRNSFQHYTTGDLRVENAVEVVKLGMKHLGVLGLGGMVTRGFGRLKVLGLD